MRGVTRRHPRNVAKSDPGRAAACRRPSFAMNRVPYLRFSSLAVLLAVTGCSGSGTGDASPSTEFLVLRTEPDNNAQLFLNDSINIDFSTPVDINSVDQSNITFEVRDQFGTVVSEPVAGTFQLATSPGDAAVGRRLAFVPRLPTNDSFTNGGFRPGRTYTVQLVGGNQVNGTVLRSTTGRALAVPITFQFHTADGTTPGALFRNTALGGPHRVGLDITPAPDLTGGAQNTGVVLNKLGSPQVEVRLLFDQPLNPSSANVPVFVETNPLLRSDVTRGRIYLEYDDPVLGPNRWIPAEVELESNRADGSTVVLRPIGVLPNNATIRVVVAATFEDISGESNVSSAAYQTTFGTFPTKRAYEQQFDALVDSFDDDRLIDFNAAFTEPMAEVGPGYVKAGFDFEGSDTTLVFAPPLGETILNTNFTQVTAQGGSTFNVSGGVFNFQSVNIQTGATVRGQGSNPMVWLVAGDFRVAGTLSVAGGNADPVMTSGTANQPKLGGYGACGGGDGGSGSPSTTARDLAGGTGRGPLQAADKGGVGGATACNLGCTRGAGGGGGGMATQGDPYYKVKAVPASSTPLAYFMQQVGIGGPGCGGTAGSLTRSLAGGGAAGKVFVDARDDNNYWGGGLRLDVGGGLRITGELTVPVGGGGGGAGGDLSYNSSCNTQDSNFQADFSGGGGGGGGGVLVVKALGRIIIDEGGRISADGGSGGGGEANGSCNKAGGGGGGAGGMVVLMSASGIDIHARYHTTTGNVPHYNYGDTASPNYDFSISADGGVCRTTSFGTPYVQGKYPANGSQPMSASNYDAAPLGGFGGLGIVQLMAPPGDPSNNVDSTNTILDDNIRIYGATGELSGATKKAVLAWRGFPDASGAGVDDQGTATAIGDSEGDIRPAPVLLPSPIAQRTRLRSIWIDTGASARRDVGPVDDGLPRGVITGAGIGETGPHYEFSGVNPSTEFAPGFAKYTVSASVAKVDYATAVAATTVVSLDSAVTFLGQPAYKVELAQDALGTTLDRYTGYEAELLNAGDSKVASFRILSHTGRTLTLAPEGATLPALGSGSAQVAKLLVRAKFFKVFTNGAEGLGATYIGVPAPGQTGSRRVPRANVQIGFAFHKNPKDNTAGNRYPATGFTYDLEDPAVQEAVRALGASFVQWDVVFDSAYKGLSGDAPPALAPTTPRPELHFLRLPFRF